MWLGYRDIDAFSDRSHFWPLTYEKRVVWWPIRDISYVNRYLTGNVLPLYEVPGGLKSGPRLLDAHIDMIFLGISNW